jgi:hypothetical protein
MKNFLILFILAFMGCTTTQYVMVDPKDSTKLVEVHKRIIYDDVYFSSPFYYNYGWYNGNYSFPRPIIVPNYRPIIVNPYRPQQPRIIYTPDRGQNHRREGNAPIRTFPANPPHKRKD